MKTIIEPFRIKSVEAMPFTTKDQRESFIKEANYNLFSLHADSVMIDLLTDSGTSAMSAAQWGALQQGDESYAGSRSFFQFKDAVQELMPFKHIIPTHQGRAAEKILSTIVTSKGKNPIIPNNTHFDTTRANFEFAGATALDFVIEEGLDPSYDFPFKGNMDCNKLNIFLKENHQNVPLVMLTITNNAGGGQPVSLENIRQTKELCHKFGIPLFIDSCRFAENAYFIQQREPTYKDWTIKAIVNEIFSHADGMTMSAKKDAFANIGGWLALNDDEWAETARALLILTEGFPTYGGLTGRDLAAIAVGLKEIIDENYLKYRISTTQYIGENLEKMGIPTVKPAGGHAVFVDAKNFLPHIDPLEYPGQALAVALYLEGGIRSCEIGSVMFGRQADGSEVASKMELVRLAWPRRVYTQSHADYVLECFESINAKRQELRGYKITHEPKQLRHFTAEFSPL